jgi:hypothetical protein
LGLAEIRASCASVAGGGLLQKALQFPNFFLRKVSVLEEVAEQARDGALEHALKESLRGRIDAVGFGDERVEGIGASLAANPRAPFRTSRLR